ncbi:phospholipase D-like protein [Pontibacter ummariensis]|uniref:Phospholipase_D-nuclease N-terminal n=1 Tax=Pontibacter ummariensis TaxID=1610492 RepID=A0A239JTE5_9BACT|nr:PLD nuclease N-terminal domain-containing protein [Pontibacter ummariensis]PRY07413.1 phospholipase D-like protein [Pontibacter ummariensis]SNT08842.1 Phospholipase_D-nuclease N-terminal [Pontibacter ummariensis]
MKENVLLFIGGIGVIELFLVLLFLVIPVGLWLWALIDMLQSDFTDKTNKLIWAIVIIFVPVLGALLYLLIGRSQKVKQQKS